MKKRMTSTPHDAVFKRFLRHPETANDFLTLHLPEAIRQQCDFSTLRLEPASFVDEDLRAWYSDVLWSVQTPCGLGYVYVVIEHQSSPDNHMAFRLMRYAIAAMQRHLDAGHKTLPLVVPMLFYHGATSPYPFSLNWLDEFADPQMARTLYAGNTADPSVFLRRLARRLPQYEERLMSIAQKLKQEGIQEGRQEGRLEGLQEGSRREALRIAGSMLQNGLDTETVQRITGLSADELKPLHS